MKTMPSGSRHSANRILVQKAHKLAIAGFQAWLEQHPKASHRAKVRQFDICCDSAALQVLLDEKEKQAA